MNILFVTGMFVKENQSDIGGMPNYIYKAATALQQRGHKVYVLTADDRTYNWEYKGIPIYSVKEFPHVTRFAWIAYGVQNILRELVLQKKIGELVSMSDIDIIQYTGWFGVGLFHNRKRGIPAVMRMSSYAKVQLVANFNARQISVISKMECWACRNMNGIFAPSKVIAREFSKDVHREVKVIETPFQLEISRENWDFSLYNEKLKGTKYFLFFGRLTPDKGILTIARSLYQMLNTHKDISFVFAGNLTKIEGKDVLDILNDYGKEHKERIIYLGALGKEQLYPVIDGAYAVLIPSLMDNLPNSCMEAMYLKKVVIGTRGTSLDQLIEDDVSGLLMEPDSKDMLISRMNEVLEMPLEVMRRIGENAHRRIKLLNPEVTIKQLEEYYMRMLEKSRTD